jgi:hypothetical protein
MKILTLFCPFLLALSPALGISQLQVEPPPISIVVKAGKLLDVGKGKLHRELVRAQERTASFADA